MFESLTDKLSRTLRNLRGVGKLTEENISEALGEVRKALLSADVHFRTAREFIDEVKDACLGQEVLKSVSPGQQVIKIIHDELVKLLGEGTTQLREDRPLRILMVGLHGAGKTTTSAKLAKRLAKDIPKTSWIARNDLIHDHVGEGAASHDHVAQAGSTQRIADVLDHDVFQALLAGGGDVLWVMLLQLGIVAPATTAADEARGKEARTLVIECE